MDTVVFHVNALTGEDLANPTTTEGGVLQGQDVVAGSLVDAFFIPNAATVGKKDKKPIGGGFIVLFDEFLQVSHLLIEISPVQIPTRTTTGPFVSLDTKN